MYIHVYMHMYLCVCVFVMEKKDTHTACCVHEVINYVFHHFDAFVVVVVMEWSGVERLGIVPVDGV